jgi:uncharacterized protein (TIGR02466 family)
MKIDNLFPTPIGFFEFKNSLSKTQKEFVDSQPKRPNAFNICSENRYILQHKRLMNVKNFIEDCLDEYLKYTISPKENTKLKITQSWLNWTAPKEQHHKHAHPNSLISGCLYISANKNTDKIYFYNETYKQIKLSPSNWNPYNSESWWYPVGTGDLILFPSSLTHMVQPVEGDETRISLAFNTFPIGNIGEENELTALTLDG